MRKPKEKSIFGSPLEKKFYLACEKQGIKLIPQYPVNNYKLDFLCEENGKKFAIEIDGSRYHKTKKQMSHDYKRQRFLRLNGYDMIRFTGHEVHYDIESCVQELIKFKDMILL